MPLSVLTDREVSEYVASLDLSPGTEAYRTLQRLLLLSRSTFARAVSALAGGLLSFTALRALPAMNDRLVEELINTRLGTDDPDTLAWRYREEWLPASLDLPALRRAAIGQAGAYLARKFYDRWGTVIRPRYDFLKTDPTAYHTYAEAYSARMIIASLDEALEPIERFREAHTILRASFPELLQPIDTDCPILRLVESMLTQPIFLERPGGGGRIEAPLLEDVLCQLYLNVAPRDYDRFLREVAVPAMVEVAEDDASQNGAPGASALLAATPWEPLPETGLTWFLARLRMTRVHLPEAYGSLVSSPTQLAEDRARLAAILTYLDVARQAIIDFRSVIERKLAEDASRYRSTPGSCLGGLLLCLTRA